MTVTVTDAYRRCDAITRREAKNFSYGIRLLRPPERAAMSALYAVARRIDDIGDGDQPAATRLAALASTRRQLRSLAAGLEAAGLDAAGLDGAGDDAVLVALADTIGRYRLPVRILEEVIDGCEMDVCGTSYATFEELVGYCRRVAGSIGRLSVTIYGPTRPDTAAPLADALGVALQLTNILRDVVEDRDTMGRVYLPGEDRERFGVGPDLDGGDDALMALIRFEAARAVTWYDQGLSLLPLLDRRARACTAAMAGIYRQLLTTIQSDPLAVTRGRLSLPPRRKAVAAVRALALGRA